ncbi:uncharacterized protein V6R79_022449 [Siganus canaliculatus]
MFNVEEPEPIYGHERSRRKLQRAGELQEIKENWSQTIATMYEPPHYDSPPVYSPPNSTTSYSLYPTLNAHSTHSHYIPYTCNAPPPPHRGEEQPQTFYKWFSPPGFVRTFQGAVALMCFVIFACVASTLVWDFNGVGYNGYGSYGYSGVKYEYSGSYVSSYSSTYSSTYMTPKSAKWAMIGMTAVNFVVSLGFLVASFSRSRITRGCRFYLTVFISDIVLAILQGIIDIIFAIGVNPMAQSSQSLLYNPLLMMCQTNTGTPSLSGSIGSNFPGEFLSYNRYLHHYCYMDPEEAAALVLGLMVVLVLCLSAYFAYKTRSKIWRHGKVNIVWDEPRVRPPGGQEFQDWMSRGGEVTPSAPELRMEGGVAPYSLGAVSVYSHGNDKNNSFSADGSSRRAAEPQHQSRSISSSEETEKKQRKSREARTAAQDPVESQYETGYTTGDTGNELDQDHTHLYRLYPEIISDQQRRHYRKEFDSDLAHYKSLCARLDDISDQIHKLSRELDTLDSDSARYQLVADEFNRLKDLKKKPEYQAKKKRCKELRQKLFHIKRLVKIYDQGLC